MAAVRSHLQWTKMVPKIDRFRRNEIKSGLCHVEMENRGLCLPFRKTGLPNFM